MDDKWSNKIEKQQNGTVLIVLLRALYCFLLNASHSIQELRVLIQGLNIACIYTFIEISNLCKAKAFRSPRSFVSAFLSFRFPSIEFCFRPFLFSVPKTTLRYTPRYFREVRITFFLIGEVCFIAWTYRLVHVFFLFLFYILLFDSRTAFSTAFFNISRINSSNIVPLSWQ